MSSSSTELKQQVLFRLGAPFLSPWVSMSLAICFELFGTIHAKLSNGLTLQIPSSIMYISYMTSVTFLALALDTSNSSSSNSLLRGGGLDLGVAYATWSGLGTIVAALYGVLQAGETLNTAQWTGLALTSIGITLVNVAPEWSFCCVGGLEGRSGGGEQERLLNTTTTTTTTRYGFYYNHDDHEADIGHV
jgi:multidrug transporter EmrE-like cation transporter